MKCRGLWDTGRRHGSPPARGAWIEMCLDKSNSLLHTSPPARGAWIEILKASTTAEFVQVAPRTGGVD